jgi:hypothetical protein
MSERICPKHLKTAILLSQQKDIKNKKINPRKRKVKVITCKQYRYKNNLITQVTKN